MLFVADANWQSMVYCLEVYFRRRKNVPTSNTHRMVKEVKNFLKFNHFSFTALKIFWLWSLIHTVFAKI